MVQSLMCPSIIEMDYAVAVAGKMSHGSIPAHPLAAPLNEKWCVLKRWSLLNMEQVSSRQYLHFGCRPLPLSRLVCKRLGGYVHVRSIPTHHQWRSELLIWGMND